MYIFKYLLQLYLFNVYFLNINKYWFIINYRFIFMYNIYDYIYLINK